MLSNAYAAVSFACADDGIGKCDRSTLSQQALMELFIFGLNESEKICGSRDDPDDLCKWEGVTCNADGEVEKFECINKHKDGTGTLASGTSLAIIQDFLSEYPLGTLALCSFSTRHVSFWNIFKRKQCCQTHTLQSTSHAPTMELESATARRFLNKP